MANLNVESLFNNIPLEDTVKKCTENRFSKQLYIGTLTKSILKKILATASIMNYLKSSIQTN